MSAARQNLLDAFLLFASELAPFQQLRETEHVTHWRAQFVAGAREKFVLGMKRGFELRRSFADAAFEISVRGAQTRVQPEDALGNVHARRKCILFKRLCDEVVRASVHRLEVVSLPRA